MQGYFRKRGEKWSFSIDLPRDPVTNKRRQKTVSGFKTKKEAEKACAALITEIERSEYVEPTKKTVADFMREWLASKELSISRDTRATYESLINVHIVPALGRHELIKLNREHVFAFYKDLKDKVGDSTLFIIHSLLKRVMTQAVEWQLVRQNIISTIDSPKVTKKEFKVWTLEECTAFLDCAKKSRLYIAFLLALTTGMRQGEILGLRWQDVDFEEGFISIAQTFKRSRVLAPGAKTKSGNRLISIDENTIKELKAHKKRVLAEKVKIGPAYTELGLVVPSTVGTPTGHRNLLKVYERLIDRSGLPKITFHGLRHTHATLLLSQGVNPKIVSERLGHANVAITLNTYSHVLPNMQKETAANFGRMFFEN